MLWRQKAPWCELNTALSTENNDFTLKIRLSYLAIFSELRTFQNGKFIINKIFTDRFLAHSLLQLFEQQCLRVGIGHDMDQSHL